MSNPAAMQARKNLKYSQCMKNPNVVISSRQEPAGHYPGDGDADEDHRPVQPYPVHHSYPWLENPYLFDGLL
jgi:hypothetical protein